MQFHLGTPFGITAVNIDGNHVKILLWTGVVVRPHGLLHVLIAPAVVPLVLEKVALNPAFGWLDFFIDLREGPFPHAPEDSAEDIASVTVGETRRAHEHVA